ncbi:MAG: MaoC/PaaZ C-terminal domain-containing protein [Alphaproteobacteria bacterium]
MNGNYFEDLNVGDAFSSGPVSLTEDDIVSFAKVFDPQPVHADPNSAEAGKFGGVIASGSHTLALAFQLHVASGIFGDGFEVGLGLETVKWPSPVRGGDALRAEVIVTEKRDSSSRPLHGIVKSELRAKNQCGQVVLIMTSVELVKRRPTT